MLQSEPELFYVVGGIKIRLHEHTKLKMITRTID